MDDVEIIEWYFGNSLKCKEVSEAWNKIKDRLQTTVQRQLPDANAQSPSGDCV